MSFGSNKKQTRRHKLWALITAAAVVQGAVLLIAPSPAAASVDCSIWSNPTEAQSISNYETIVVGGPWNIRRGPSYEAGCDKGVNSNSGDAVTVYAVDGEWAYIQNVTSGQWGWTHVRSLGATPIVDSSSETSPVTPTAPSAPIGVDCSTWTSPADGQSLSQYAAAVTGGPWNIRRGPSLDPLCDKGVNSFNDDAVQVYARADDWLYVHNRTQDEWGWISSGAFAADSPPVDAPPDTEAVPTAGEAAPTSTETLTSICWLAESTEESAEMELTADAVVYDGPSEPYPACMGNERGVLPAGDVVQVQARGGGYLQLESGAWIRASATDPDRPSNPPENPEPSPPLTVSNGEVRSCTTETDTFEVRMSWDKNGLVTTDWQYTATAGLLYIHVWTERSTWTDTPDLNDRDFYPANFWTQLAPQTEWNAIDPGFGPGQPLGTVASSDGVTTNVRLVFEAMFIGGEICTTGAFP